MPRSLYTPLFILSALFLAALSGYLIGNGRISVLLSAIALVTGVFLTLSILRYPYIGLGCLFLGIPLIELLPDVPLGTSAFTLLGIVTFGSYFLQSRRSSKRLQYPLTMPFFLAMVYIGWIFLSNPEAAVLRGRNWVFTYIQLVILMLLMRQLMTDQKQHLIILGFFVAGVTISAAYLIVNANSVENLAYQGEILGGLVGNSNEAARYFVIGIPILDYLRNYYENRLKLRFFITSLMLVMILGTIYTLSRTGFLLLAVALALLLLGRPSPSYKRKISLSVVVFMFSFLLILSQTQALDIIQSQLLPRFQSLDTSGDIRSDLWRAGILMWHDHPLQGVGVGQFGRFLSAYAVGTRAEGKTLGAHNIFIAVLAEEGLIGAVLFVLLVITVGWTLWKAARLADANTSAAPGRGLPCLLCFWLVDLQNMTSTASSCGLLLEQVSVSSLSLCLQNSSLSPAASSPVC